MKVSPATLMVPVLGALPALVSTVYCTVPDAVPAFPDVIVIQLALLPAVQMQPLFVCTSTLPAPPPFLNDSVLGLIEQEQA